MKALEGANLSIRGTFEHHRQLRCPILCEWLTNIASRTGLAFENVFRTEARLVMNNGEQRHSAAHRRVYSVLPRGIKGCVVWS